MKEGADSPGPACCPTRTSPRNRYQALCVRLPGLSAPVETKTIKTGAQQAAHEATHAHTNTSEARAGLLTLTTGFVLGNTAVRREFTRDMHTSRRRKGKEARLLTRRPKRPNALPPKARVQVHIPHRAAALPLLLSPLPWKPFAACWRILHDESESKEEERPRKGHMNTDGGGSGGEESGAVSTAVEIRWPT